MVLHIGSTKRVDIADKDKEKTAFISNDGLWLFKVMPFGLCNAPLGHLVTADGISTDEDKIRAVKDWPRPQKLHELRSILGLCTYYRRFVPNLASIAASLHELAKKS